MRHVNQDVGQVGQPNFVNGIMDMGVAGDNYCGRSMNSEMFSHYSLPSNNLTGLRGQNQMA